MATTVEKTPNYSAMQEGIILALAASKGGTLNLDDAKTLAADPRMNDNSGNERNYRSIVAKIGRMATAKPDAIAYATKQPETKKDGVKKSDLVARIGAVVAGNMEGLEKAKLPALVAIADYLDSLPSVSFEPDEGEDAESVAA